MRTFINIEWKNPELRDFSFPVEDADGRRVIDIGFRMKDITLSRGERTGQKQYSNASLQFLTNRAGQATHGDVSIATFNDGILVDARAVSGSCCAAPRQALTRFYSRLASLQ